MPELSYLRYCEAVTFSFHEACQVMVHVVKHHVNATLHAIDSVHCKGTYVRAAAANHWVPGA